MWPSLNKSTEAKSRSHFKRETLFRVHAWLEKKKNHVLSLSTENLKMLLVLLRHFSKERILMLCLPWMRREIPFQEKLRGFTRARLWSSWVREAGIKHGFPVKLKIICSALSWAKRAKSPFAGYLLFNSCTSTLWTLETVINLIHFFPLLFLTKQ